MARSFSRPAGVKFSLHWHPYVYSLSVKFSIPILALALFFLCERVGSIQPPEQRLAACHATNTLPTPVWGKLRLTWEASNCGTGAKLSPLRSKDETELPCFTSFPLTRRHSILWAFATCHQIVVFSTFLLWPGPLGSSTISFTLCLKMHQMDFEA
jgi:hypothetical protein